MSQAVFALRTHNPDVLTCIANLSNDEVVTPPDVVNQMLNTLEKSWAESTSGENIWTNKEIKFLDPATKSGVFLREIVKRLNSGLASEIPDLTERVNHILKNQVYGIAITELTGLLARRSIYCSKNAISIHSIVRGFNFEQGNIWFERTEHNWNSGRCDYCGANEEEYGRGSELETYAYRFIHSANPKNLIAEIFGGDVHFDVVIGNPPYQLSVGNISGNSSKARAIYHEFISQAIALNPRFVSMIVPSRWMTRSAEGIPETWIDDFINDKRIRVLHDFLDSTHVFPGVQPIKGGVCYFLWNRDAEGKCEYVLHKGQNIENFVTNTNYLNAEGVGIVVRDIQAISILEKVKKIDGDWLTNPGKNFSSIVSPKDFFTNKESLTSSWTGFFNKKDSKHPIKYYLNKSMHQIPFGWIGIDQIPKNPDISKLYKVYIPAASWGSAKEFDDPVLGKPFLGEPNSVCSQTYLVIGYQQTQKKLTEVECENIRIYISTKFFRYLVSLKKHTQNGPRGVYQFVPMQDFSKAWTDEKLNKRYGLTKEEIEFIDKRIRPMDLDGE